MERVFVVRYSEIGLKGKNREFFEKRLIDNIITIVKPAAVNKRYGRIIVRIGRNDPNVLEERLRYVLGIQNYSLGCTTSRFGAGKGCCTKARPK